MKRISSDVRAILLGTLIMALVSTLADAIWAAVLTEHRAVYGLVHGGLLFGVFGPTLTWLVGASRLLPWGVAGVLIGVLGAVVFYGLLPFVGSVAMLVAWMGLWLAFAQVADRAAAVSEGDARPVLRGVVAAVLSGIGFWLISGIWLGPHDPGPLYWRNFAAWCVAFVPGFLALLGGRAEPRS